MNDAERLAAYPVVIELAVMWGEMDAFNHINNIVYFRYFEQCRLEYCRRVGWTEFTATTGVGPILAQVEARYRKALRYPDTIAVGARVINVTDDRFTMEHLIVSRALGAVATEGKGVIVAYDYAAQKKALLPGDVRQRIAELEASSGAK